jgi:hypothetical protein
MEEKYRTDLVKRHMGPVGLFRLENGESFSVRFRVTHCNVAETR